MLSYQELKDNFSTQIEVVEMDLSDKEFEGLYYKNHLLKGYVQGLKWVQTGTSLKENN